MSNEERKHCIHECQGTDININFTPDGNKPHTNYSRDCEFFVKRDIKKSTKIENIIKQKEQRVYGTRCSFLDISATNQKECPYFE